MKLFQTILPDYNHKKTVSSFLTFENNCIDNSNSKISRIASLYRSRLNVTKITF